jgi:hypothetical protein
MTNLKKVDEVDNKITQKDVMIKCGFSYIFLDEICTIL